jgi:hypothetical protein
VRRPDLTVPAIPAFVGIEQASFRVVVGKDARRLDRRSRFSPQRATDEAAKRMAPLLER